MNQYPSEPGPPEVELQRQRELIRRSLLRANTAVAVVLLAVLALAGAAVLYGYRAAQQRRAAQQQQRRAEEAEREGRELVYRSALAQSRAERLAAHLGARVESLALLTNAARHRLTAELRTEALACLSMLDAAPMGPLHTVSGNTRFRDFSPDLELMLTCDARGNFTVYRTTNYSEVFRFSTSASRVMARLLVRAGRFSPNGRYYAAIAREGLAVWDLEQRRLIFDHAPAPPGSVANVTFSGDSRFVVFSTSFRGGEVAFYDLATGRERPHKARIGRNPFALHFHAPQVAVAATNEVQFWNYETGERLRALPSPQRLTLLFWSADGHVLLGAAPNGQILMWKLDREEFHALAGHTEGANIIGLTDAGDLVMSASPDGTTRLWDVESGRALLTLPGQALSFATDDERIGFEVDRSRVGVWRIQRPRGFRTLGAREARGADLLSADLTPSGRWLAALVAGDVQVWDLERSAAGPVLAATAASGLAWHPDESALFVCRTGLVERMRLQVDGASSNRAPRLTPEGSNPLPTAAYAHQLAVSADHTTLAVELADRRVLTFLLANPAAPAFLERQSTTRNRLGWATPTGSGRMALSADGRWICAAYGFTNRAVVLDTRTGKTVTEFEAREGGAAFSPDGHWLATSGGSRYEFRKVGTWELERSLPRETLLGRRGLVAFARQGRLVAITRDAGTIELLDAVSLESLAALSPPRPQSLVSLRISHDGGRLVAGTANGLALVWDLQVFREQLAALGLDWSRPPAAATRVLASSPAPSEASPTTPIALGLAAAGLATFFALSALRRHRLLVHDFARVESEAQRRHRELEVAKVELMHSQKMKALGTLAAGIAHDFNNLLSVIRMSNKLIGRATGTHADVAEEVANIEEAVQQGKQVVSSMLGYSREGGEDNGVCDLDEAVEETVSLLSKEFLSGIELTLALDRQAPRVNISRGRLEQILLNLVVNASEAMKGQGKLRIGVRAAPPEFNGSFVLRPRPAARWVELSVTDSGAGIPAEILPRIFEPFFTTKTAGAKQGTGLGLSMVYTIAEREGLGIAVDSEPGRGTTFRLWLPACAPDAQFPTSARRDK